MKKMSVRSKFRIGAAAILIIFCATGSMLVYYYLKKMATDDIYRETEIFIGTADATRTYVKDVLRPKMTALLPEGMFIPHAMSTSFVGREIMERLQQRFPNFQYKRAAANPMNRANLADGFEKKMLSWFADHRDKKEWHGIIEKDNAAYYTRLRAIYAEKECLVCHGNPADAPAAVREIYGTDGGYFYQENQVVAADTIYIPVGVTFVRIKEAVWLIFLIAFTALLALVGLFHLLFNRTVVTELAGLLHRFRTIVSPAGSAPEPSADSPGDEIDQLKMAFEVTAMDLQQAHDGLKASESKYRMLFESSQDAIVIIDSTTEIADINPSGVQLFGFKDRAEACSVETAYQLFWDTRDAESFFETVRQGHSIKGQEYALVDRQGKKRIVMISATQRTDDEGNFNGIDASLRDVTEKRKMANQLAQTEKLASIGQLASGVAHEINNPLGVIHCYSNLIAKTVAPETQIMNDIKTIQKHTDQCKSVVEALLNFARVSESATALTDIHACIEEMLDVLETQMKNDGIQVRRRFAEELPPLTLDAHKIRQVLMNLLINARQALSGGGTIEIRTDIDKSQAAVLLEISDTGTGIPEKYIGKIFDPFFTTKSAGQGTGLGLSVSYGIIKQHGGDIRVKSRIGQGTTFTILLPMEKYES